MPEKNKPIIKKVEYMGETYDVDMSAIQSVKVQRALANGDSDPAKFYQAIDMACCGNLDEYAEKIPEADGTMGPYGTSMPALLAFFEFAAEQVNGSKN